MKLNLQSTQQLPYSTVQLQSLPEFLSLKEEDSVFRREWETLISTYIPPSGSFPVLMS